MADETDPFDPFKREGWDLLGQLDGNQPMTPEQKAVFEEHQLKEYELNSAIHRALTSPDGQVLFEFMRELATEGARFDVATETDPALAAAKGFFREGQAAIFFELRNRMNRAMAGPPQVQKE